MPVERDFALDTNFEQQKESLRKVLDREDISPLARELTVEALRDWVAIEAANGHYFVPEYKSVEIHIDSPVSKDGGELEAGQEYVFTHRFGDLPEGEELAQAGELGTVAFSYDLEEVKIEILPTIYRHVLMDIYGRSKPTRFLMTIPEGQRDRAGSMKLDVIVGNQWVLSEAYFYMVI